MWRDLPTITQNVRLTPTGARTLVIAEPLPMLGYSRPMVYPGRGHRCCRALHVRVSAHPATSDPASARLGVLDGRLRGEGHGGAAAACAHASHQCGDRVLHGNFGHLLSCTAPWR
jgi:hypothetical protein